MKLKWINTNRGSSDPSERGYWRSVEGRFEIGPNFNHSIYPSGYTVEDRLLQARANRAGMGEDQRRDLMRRSARSYDTVRDCKAWAVEVINKELAA